MIPPSRQRCGILPADEHCVWKQQTSIAGRGTEKSDMLVSSKNTRFQLSSPIAAGSIPLVESQFGPALAWSAYFCGWLYNGRPLVSVAFACGVFSTLALWCCAAYKDGQLDMNSCRFQLFLITFLHLMWNNFIIKNTCAWENLVPILNAEYGIIGPAFMGWPPTS